MILIQERVGGIAIVSLSPLNRQLRSLLVIVLLCIAPVEVIIRFHIKVFLGFSVFFYFLSWLRLLCTHISYNI